MTDENGNLTHALHVEHPYYYCGGSTLGRRILRVFRLPCGVFAWVALLTLHGKTHNPLLFKRLLKLLTLETQQDYLQYRLKNNGHNES